MHRLTTQQVATILGVCRQRVAAKLMQGHFPNAGRCECGHTILIPLSDIEADLARVENRKNAQ